VKEFLDTSVQLVTYDLADDVLFDVMEYRAEKHVRSAPVGPKTCSRSVETYHLDITFVTSFGESEIDNISNVVCT